jgi:DNA-binding HxlR family transcriptional regulator
MLLEAGCNHLSLQEMETVFEDKRKCPAHESSVECSKRLLPINDALEILNGKWKLQVIMALSFGKKRFKQLQREIPGITPKVLSKELKDLEMNELARRTVYDTSPITVEYELLPYGRTLRPLIDELHKWGTKHRKRIIGK